MKRQEALEAGEKRYCGEPCKNCGSTERYASDGGCVACKRSRYADDRDRRIARARKYRLKKRYGITPEEYDQQLLNQDGRCRLCRHVLDGTAPHIDHCHVSGRVRGILCGRCNRGMGLLQDSPDLMERAARYIRDATSQ